MEFTLKNVLKVLAVPVTLLLVYLSFLGLWNILNLPPEEQVIESVTLFFDQYGLIVVFGAALIEGLLLFGNYFPGGLVIFLGVLTAIGDIPRAVTVVLVTSLAFFVAYTIDYYLGRYGWYALFIKFGLQSTLDSMQKKVSRHMFTAIISSYWLPNLAAICATTAGILRIPLRTFLVQSTVGLLIWNTFWGMFVYLTGDAALSVNLFHVFIAFFIWSGLVLGKVFIFDKKTNPPIES